MNLLIGIPAYNEQMTIGKVIRSLPKKIAGIEKIDMIIVDDGSTDDTAAVAQNNKGIVFKHLMNRGLGAALKTIFAYAKEKDYQYLVTIDADGQHDGNDIKSLINPLMTNKADVCIGSRWLKTKNAPASRITVNSLANILTFLLFGILTSDSQSGFRAFNKKAIKTINLQGDRMEASSEFFREIYKNKLQFVEIPIKAVYTNYSQAKGQKLTNFVSVFIELIIRFLK